MSTRIAWKAMPAPVRVVARNVVRGVALGAAALLGGCYYTPYPPVYAGGYPAVYAARPVYGAVVVGAPYYAPYYRGRYWR